MGGMKARRCGECQLCCKLLPVRAVDKRGGERCRYQKFGTGCTVYRRLEIVAPECRLWNCRWLVNDDTADLHRPDHAHYVIDIMPDIITIRDNDTGKTVTVACVQVWIDPAFPEAHRDPLLRAYLARRGEQEAMPAIIRTSPKTGFVLFPPALTPDGQWRADHTAPLSGPGLWDRLAALRSEGRLDR